VETKLNLQSLWPKTGKLHPCAEKQVSFPKNGLSYIFSQYTVLLQHKLDVSIQFEEALICQIIYFIRHYYPINTGDIALPVSLLSFCSQFILEGMFRFDDLWYRKPSPSMKLMFLAYFWRIPFE
jgi:hypothetical protein